MTQLTQRRTDISALRRKRLSLRRATAYCAVGTAVLWTLAVAFLIDFRLEASVLFRAALLFAIVAVVAWAWQRVARPWLRDRETDLDVALMIEDQCRAERSPLGSDLVAAIQFESPQAANWGSVALEQVVVEDVAARSVSLDVMAGLRTEVLARRATVLLVSAVVFAAAVAIFPGHAAAFFNRVLLLGRMHYPTATLIDKIILNGKELLPAIGREPVAVACPQGQPLSIEVFVSGELPTVGRMELQITDERKLTVELSPVAKADELADRQWTVYTGKVDRLNDSATYQVYLGDAWTDPAQLDLVPMPVVDCQLSATPPEYARAAMANRRDQPSAGARNLEVLEGSHVVVDVECRNKRLASASMVIDGKMYPLASLGGDDRRWRLDPKGTPIASIGAELTYQITAVDEDGLSPERPTEGVVRIKPDRPPRITAQAKTRFVLPTGRPAIEYRTSDDYAVAQVVAKAIIVRETANGPQRLERPPMAVATGSPTLSGADGQRRLYVAPFASLDLRKGDKLELVFEATDFRGPTPGKSAASEALTFLITDVAGVESAVTEIDPVLEQQIQSLIQEHLGIGESK